MTYDINGTWEKYMNFNAPLYSDNTTQQSKLSVDSSIGSWLKAGVPAEKIIMGVPFYGYRYTSVNKANNGLYQNYSGGSSINYANIAANYLKTPGYARYFHPESMVPWLFNGSTFISYEDEESMKSKGQYIRNKGLGGGMIWELSQDPNRILLNSLYNGLKEQKDKGIYAELRNAFYYFTKANKGFLFIITLDNLLPREYTKNTIAPLWAAALLGIIILDLMSV